MSVLHLCQTSQHTDRSPILAVFKGATGQDVSMPLPTRRLPRGHCMQRRICDASSDAIAVNNVIAHGFHVQLDDDDGIDVRCNGDADDISRHIVAAAPSSLFRAPKKQNHSYCFEVELLDLERERLRHQKQRMIDIKASGRLWNPVSRAYWRLRRALRRVAANRRLERMSKSLAGGWVRASSRTPPSSSLSS